MASPELYKGKYSGVAESALRSALKSEGYDLMTWQDGTGATYSPHSHPHDEYIVVYAGAMDFIIGGRRYAVESGDALLLPANTVHEAVNESTATVHYFICT